MMYSKVMKRILSLGIILLIGLSCLSVTASAAEQPVLAAGTATGKPGDTVQVELKLRNNPGIVALRLFLQYDHTILKLVKAENGTLFPENVSTFGNNLDAENYAMLWADSTASVNMAQDGVLAKLTFEIAETAADTAQITLSYDENSTFNVDLDNVTFTAQNGTVTIKAAASDVPTVAMRNFVSFRTVDYRTTISFTAVVENPVSGAEVRWFIDGKNTAPGETYTQKEAKKDFTVQVKYMQGDKVLAASETETVKVNSGFFARLVAFFRSLFKKLPVVSQAYLGVQLREQ